MTTFQRLVMLEIIEKDRYLGSEAFGLSDNSHVAIYVD
jgi:hypothetical protein